MLTRAEEHGSHEGPIGLDDRPRPASARARIVKGLKQSAPFSSLQRRIIFFNLMGLAMLVAGMTYLANNRSTLVEVYVEALRKQGEIVAIGIAETAATEQYGLPAFDHERAATVLSRLAKPTGARIRIYDTGHRLAADTHNLPPAGPPLKMTPLGPPRAAGSTDLTGFVDSFYESMEGYLYDVPPIHYEVPVAGISLDQEVVEAARGKTKHAVRVNSEGETIVSVAMPIKRLKAIVGVLQLSTRGGDIEYFITQERQAILEVFFLAAIVSVLLSILLANMIASPIRELATAAQSEGASAARPVSPDRPEIPDLTYRTDEIGELSGSLIRMTDALHARIDAIESFAADVAHEIKNPLTSLRSAVETLAYARTAEQGQKLLDVIENDVKRMDRLVTDISNASRLDAELVRERMEPVDLSQLISMLAEIAAEQGSARNVRVVTDLPRRSLITRGLEGHLGQVITNLLGNALSFSPKGTTIVVRGIRTENGAVRVIVEDQGPGIPPENLSSIFQRFYTSRPEEEAFGNHSGLGLSISKQIIETHGGKIWAENKPGDPPSGARFIFELPE